MKSINLLILCLVFALVSGCGNGGGNDPPPTSTTNQPANGTISSPSGSVTINVGDSVYFIGEGTDPENDLPLTYLWTFGAGSGVSPSSQQNPGLIQFNNPGVYTVVLTVTDALGNADPTSPTLTVTVSAVSINQPANGTISSPSGNVSDHCRRLGVFHRRGNGS